MHLRTYENVCKKQLTMGGITMFQSIGCHKEFVTLGDGVGGCMQTHIYTLDMHGYTYVSAFYIHIYIHTCIHTFIHIYIYTYIHAFIHYIPMFTYTLCTCKYMNSYIHSYIHV